MELHRSRGLDALPLGRQGQSAGGGILSLGDVPPRFSLATGPHTLWLFSPERDTHTLHNNGTVTHGSRKPTHA